MIVYGTIYSGCFNYLLRMVNYQLWMKSLPTLDEITTNSGWFHYQLWMFSSVMYCICVFCKHCRISCRIACRISCRIGKKLNFFRKDFNKNITQINKTQLTLYVIYTSGKTNVPKYVNI